MSQNLPKAIKKSPNELYGWRIPLYHEGMVDTIENVRQFQLSSDDVLIIAYIKSGTHWVWEAVNMLKNRTTQYEKRHKIFMQLELGDAVKRLESEPSPRILNSHLVFNHLPQNIVQQKTKIIHVTRNPKDVIVSAYFYLKQVTQTDFSMQAFLDAVTLDEFFQPSQFDYLKQILEFEQTHPDHPIRHIVYEKMIRDPVKIIQDLARFLEVSVDVELCQKIAEACSFEKMKKLDDSTEKIIPDYFRLKIDGAENALKCCRKGSVGDWKLHFTDDQNRQMDEFIDSGKNVLKRFNFTYE